MYKTVFWALWERARVGWFGTMALKHVYYHMWNESAVQVPCMIQDARGWCTGMTQRDGTGREEGGGCRMGNTCTPVADSCWCMATPIQYCKVISLQLKMAGWHHWLNGRESEWTPGVGDGQGGLVCCDSWGRKESDTTERLNWTENK